MELARRASRWQMIICHSPQKQTIKDNFYNIKFNGAPAINVSLTKSILTTMSGTVDVLERDVDQATLIMRMKADRKLQPVD